MVHGTSLLRCVPQHVRPGVKDANVQVAHNPGAALKALEDLRARSTTQFRDMMSKQTGARDMVLEEMMDEEYEEDGFQQLEAEQEGSPEFAEEYSPSIARDDPGLQELQDEFDRKAEEERVERKMEEKGSIPGTVSFMLPQLHDRERTPDGKIYSNGQYYIFRRFGNLFMNILKQKVNLRERNYDQLV